MPQHWWAVDAEGESQEVWVEVYDPAEARKYIELEFHIHRNLMATGGHLPMIGRAADYFGRADYDSSELGDLADELYRVLYAQRDSYDILRELASLCLEASANARRGWRVVVRPD